MAISTFSHQYIDRRSGSIVTENLIGDKTVSFLYNRVREQAPQMLKALTSSRMTNLLGYLHFDRPSLKRETEKKLLEKFGVNISECIENETYFDSHRKVFERKIHYRKYRQMVCDPRAVVSPADSRILLGSLTPSSSLFIKEKFFTVPELLGQSDKNPSPYENGDFAVFRLTPDKYHYNHLPVDGRVVDIYDVDGAYHSCNPAATVSLASIYSKNKRTVTIINTDIEGGTKIGLVAMIEIVALMIGDIVQCYSEQDYDNPTALVPGDFCKKGAPKSLFRPGSSTVVLLFEPGRVIFSADLLANMSRQDVQSRFSDKFCKPMVETDVMTRSKIGSANLFNSRGV